MKYTVTVRGSLPPDLAQRLAEAHVAALLNATPRPQKDAQGSASYRRPRPSEQIRRTDAKPSEPVRRTPFSDDSSDTFLDC